MTQPRQAQLDLLLTISEGLSRGSNEMLRVSPSDAMHAPSCGLAIRDAVEELRWMRAEIERLREVIRTIRARCVELDDSDAVSETLDIATAVLEDEP